MSEDRANVPTSADPEELQRQVVDLRRQLAELKIKNRAMWTLLVEVTRRLQVSTTSIKAAVSSLLDYEIFWDGSTQHEFLETIDDSVDQGADLVMLLTLAFKSEASSLEMKAEPHLLQEIVSAVLNTISEQTPEKRFDVNFSMEGSPVFVDYEYLAVALRLLLETLLQIETRPSPIKLQLVEAPDYWYLIIQDIPHAMTILLDRLHRDQFGDLFPDSQISSENILKVLAASRILRLQNIKLETVPGEGKERGLRLVVPTAVTG